MASTDWDAWHDDYADPTSQLAQRLRVVRRAIEKHLDSSAPRDVRVVSACAGDGRDLLQVLERRDDADRVSATLIEADPRNAARAEQHVRRAGLANIEVRCTDAGVESAYAGAVPADLVLLCGIFGNISDADVHRTVAAIPRLCAPQATVVWTRHREEPDLTPRIRGWMASVSCEEQEFVAPDHGVWSVGVHGFRGQTQPLEADRVLFTFVR